MENVAHNTRRKAGGKQPISRHPLFPAIVALWFGALFGLASIAIKPAIFEQLVATTHIDSLVPMAAPPLGATARILIALAMTGLGGIVGAVVARRIARPAAGEVTRRRRMQPAADLATPAFVAHEMPAQAEVAAAPVEDAETLETADARIAETADLDLEDFPEEAEAPVASFAPAAFEADEIEVEDAELAVVEDGEALEAEPCEAEATDVETAEFEVIEDEAPSFTAKAPVSNHLFDSYSRDLSSRPAAPVEQATRRDERAILSIADLDAEPGIDAEPAPGAHAPFYQAPYDRSTPFAVLTRAIIDSLEKQPEAHDEGDRGQARESQADRAPAPSGHTAADRIASADLEALSHVELLERLALAMAKRREEIAAQNAVDLGEARETFAPVAPEAAKVAPLAFKPLQFERPQVQPTPIEPVAFNETLPAEPEAPEATPFELADENVVEAGIETADFEEAETEDAAIDDTEFADTEEASEENGDPVDWDQVDHAGFEAPAAEIETSLVELAQPLEDAEPATELEQQIEALAQSWNEEPVAAQQVPAALRPVGLDSFDEGEALPGYIPPRHIGELLKTKPAAPSAPVMDYDDEAEADGEFAEDYADAQYADYAEAEDEAEDEEEVIDEGYSSLLNMSRAVPRQPFVRIGEPETDEGIQPMVIFPGDEPARTEYRFDGTQAQHEATEQPSMPSEFQARRPFDAPGRQDTDQTERALREALATLQRMSGAA
ncbi:hypothetical protein [Novosphingobium sp. KN65.2]|uniref:hypothetical protein n=1 Tax=Novosphingobium sp. KN65.2 TaxID=1478134 RepID=UPI0005DCD969|nr:hypothetical protein [Novosphingobium sp. KN65.2]CDO36756.1 hypothetical protein SPHV1_2420012 [Novosphingobium sp. KN65.2]